MERKDFLKKLMFAGVITSVLPVANSCKKEDANAACGETDSETAGPFPTKIPASLVAANIVSDRSGTSLTVNISIHNINNNCAALEGALVDIWHCDADGNYSEYGGTGMQSADYTDKHFLRGRQTTNADGIVSFNSIYPGWYSGRAPHIHVHIYSNSGNSLLITQIAFPESTSNSQVYTQGVYASRGSADTTNASDTVFRDSIANELATVTGNVSDGFVLTHSIYVKA